MKPIWNYYMNRDVSLRKKKKSSELQKWTLKISRIWYMIKVAFHIHGEKMEDTVSSIEKTR